MFGRREICLLKKSINDIELALSFEKDVNRMLHKENSELKEELKNAKYNNKK